MEGVLVPFDVGKCLLGKVDSESLQSPGGLGRFAMAVPLEYVHVARWMCCDVYIFQLAAGYDILPTLFNIAGAKVPSDRKMDGYDMAPILYYKDNVPQT